MMNSQSAAEPMGVQLPGNRDDASADADGNWRLAISLVRAWRAAGGERAVGGERAAARRLAELAASDDCQVAERAALGLLAVANMFLELYADRAGSSADAVLKDAADLRWD